MYIAIICPSILRIAIAGFINFVTFLGLQHKPLIYIVVLSRKISSTWCNHGVQVLYSKLLLDHLKPNKNLME